MFGITLNGTKTGKAGHTWEAQSAASVECDAMNQRASTLGITARYQVVPVDELWLDKNEILRKST